MICDICKQEIIDKAYVELEPTVVVQSPEGDPILYASPQIRSYYSTKIHLHDMCFISLIGTKTNLNLQGGMGLIPVSQ